MSHRAAHEVLASCRCFPGLRLLACLVLLCAVTACGSHTARQAAHYNPSRYYPPPGSASDPWGPYIHEASGRFGVPELWIRRVMRQESGGQEDVISWAGAMGLMQVMPDTYSGLRGRYSLGDDPFDPHNNILAGTAYLREMYDHYGAPGFLAAYNAGPNRLDRYLNDGIPLPEETVNYVASIAPLLGSGTPMSGPLAVYGAPNGSLPLLAARRSRGGCDPDAAYNPDGPCTPAQPRIQTAAAIVTPTPAGCDQDAAYDPTRPCQPIQSVPAPPLAVAVTPSLAPPADCDPDAAYDPTRPCRPAAIVAQPVIAPPVVAPPVVAPPVVAPPVVAPPVVAETLPPPLRSRLADGRRVDRARRPIQEASAPLLRFSPSTPVGVWAIQVGAFANLATAQAAAERARKAVPDLLRMAKTELPATRPFGSQIAFRARLAGLTPAMATDACARLSGRGMPCMTVPPVRTS
ncbi:lytic transglycosylase domain-containing protein [Rhodopila sp.]|uniref:lytic transglycosylase domain-containing protein n=1 Tax=Rhodopila sp. TaxID=2480087 RepID=UPI003D12F812